MLDQSLENVMQIQTKLFSVGGTKNHVVMIARGLLNANGPKQILRELTAVTIRCVDCKVFIDFIDAEYQVKDPEIDQLLCDARPDLLPTPQTFLGVAVLLCASVLLGSCQGSGDANQTSKANDLEGSMTAPIERGAPRNPRGPTDPSR